ncbi:MAG: PAS domain S-box protein [Homoserinimonas sp.]
MSTISAAMEREGFQALFFGNPDATFVFDTSGTFIHCNDQLIELSGYSRDELHNMTFDPLVHPDYLEETVRQFARCAMGENCRYLIRAVTKYGDPLDVDITNIPVRGTDGTVVAVIGIARDISAILAAEAARLRMKGELHSTLNQMAIGIGFVDRQWRFTFLNDMALRFLQSDLVTAIGASLLDLLPGVSETDFGAACRQAMHESRIATARAFSEDLQKWVELTAFPTAEGIVLHVTDVSEDQRTKLKLEQNAERIRSQAALLDASQEAIYLRDLDGRITYWNKGAAQLFGWNDDEAVGEHARELLPVNPEAFRTATEHVLRVGDWDGEVEMYTRDGRIVIVGCRWQLVRDDDGKATAIFAVDSDITEWKRGEDKRNRAQRLESLGTLAGGIAHDLNNVLTPILMSAQLLATSETNDSRLALLGSIESGVTRGADMVQQVLSFARGEEGVVSVLDIAALLAQVQEFSRDSLPKAIRFDLTVQTGLWPVRGDSTQLFQVLMNLITNAGDAMPGGGQLTIRAMNGADKASNRVILEVEDSGYGMDAETASKVFDPFFTTKGLGGTGLGLATSSTIIRGHGGDLDVYTVPGLGSRFRISLPAAEEGAGAEPAEPPVQDALPPGKGERILVVDDEATIREIACQTLEANGYQTLAAEHGREAIEIADRGTKIDLVFTDMMMPEMDGAETAAYFMAKHPNIAVMAASGLNANGGVARAAHSGVTSFLSKPYTTSELLVSVRETLDTWGKA